MRSGQMRSGVLDFTLNCNAVGFSEAKACRVRLLSERKLLKNPGRRHVGNALLIGRIATGNGGHSWSTLTQDLILKHCRHLTLNISGIRNGGHSWLAPTQALIRTDRGTEWTTGAKGGFK